MSAIEGCEADTEAGHYVMTMAPFNAIDPLAINNEARFAHSEAGLLYSASMLLKHRHHNRIPRPYSRDVEDLVVPIFA